MHPFPFIGAGIAAARKSMCAIVVFAAKVPVAKRAKLAVGLPQSIGDASWSARSVTVAHDGDSLSWVVRAEFEAADPDYYGETASDAQWEAFNAAFDRWLLAAHAIAPIAIVVRPIDDEYGTATNAWHDWSIAAAKQVDRALLPDWALAELDAARPSPKPRKPAKAAKPSKPAKVAKPVAKPPQALAKAIWNLSYMPQPLVDAMSYHRTRGETELEAAVFWGGVLYMPRLFPGEIDRARSKAIGRPPPDAADRFARWLRPWLEPKLSTPAKLSLDEVRHWLGWCCKIQSPVLDDWHAMLEAEVIRRQYAGKQLSTKSGFCPFCGKPLEVTYAGDKLVTARCTATGARFVMHGGDFLHRNMFDAKPTGTEFNKMSSREPDWFCARCGKRHAGRKSSDGYTIDLKCAGCKHGYTVGLIGDLYDSMHDRHAR